MMRTFLSERIRFRKTALIGGGVMVAFTAMITMFMFIGTDSAPNQGGPPGRPLRLRRWPVREVGSLV